MGYRVAVVGATGAVGREMLQTLAERKFPADKVYALASSNSSGKEISYGEDITLKIESLDSFDFTQVDIALFSAGGIFLKNLVLLLATPDVSLSIILLLSAWMKMCRLSCLR